MKKILKMSLLAIFICLFAINIGANSIEEVNVKVNITDDGTAHVSEEWKVYNTDGTEWYIPMQNLNHMSISNFRVQGEDGLEWTEDDNWNVNGSFDSKSLRYGINYTGDGLELCWGKTQMGDYTYIVSFDYINAVQAFEDYDGFLIRFVNDQMNPAPDKVSVTLSVDGVELSEENARIWSFGNRGTINFDGGKVVALDESYDSDSSMTLMMAFDKGLIHPSYQGQGTFEDLKDRAFVGSSFDNEDNSSDYHGGDEYPEYNGGYYKSPSRLSSFFRFIGNAFSGFWVLFLILIGRGIFKASSRKKVKNLKEVDFENPPYYRDTLLNNYIPAIFFMAQQKNPPKKLEENVFSAYFLKWIKEGALRPDEDLENKKKQSLIILKEPNILDSEEGALWRAVVEAAGENAILEGKELQKYFKKHYSSYAELFKKLYDRGIEYLKANDYLEADKKLLFTEKGKRECANAYAMRRFFKDFTLINERGVREVQLWDYYLIIATIYGMGEEVSKAFEKLIPDYTFAQENNNNGFYIHPYQMYYLSQSMGQSAHRGFSSGSSSARSSSGFGGGASFGGGGGFSGGGSGGGSR